MLPTRQFRSFIRHSAWRSITSSSSHNAIPDDSRIPRSALKRHPRPGKNLSERFKWLEHSLRKDVIKRELRPQPRIVPPAPAQTHLFHGFHIPQEPKTPADDECCMSGCAVCIYDLYEESLAAYKAEVNVLRKSLSSMKIPESEWPAHIRHDAVLSTETQRKETIISAFEEMELTLASKKQQQIEKSRS